MDIVNERVKLCNRIFVVLKNVVEQRLVLEQQNLNLADNLAVLRCVAVVGDFAVCNVHNVDKDNHLLFI